MRFSDIQGNDEVKRTLMTMVDSGRIPHALMFHEDEGSGAFAMAQAFLGYLFSHAYANDAELGRVSKMIHPDVHYVFPLNSGTKVTGKIEELNPDKFMEWFRELAISKPDFLESDLYEAIGIAGKSGTIASGSARYILDKLMLSSVEGRMEGSSHMAPGENERICGQPSPEDYRRAAFDDCLHPHYPES